MFYFLKHVYALNLLVSIMGWHMLLLLFFFLIDKHTKYVLEKGRLRGNPKHTGSIQESPKGKDKKGKHSPALNKNPTNQQS